MLVEDYKPYYPELTDWLRLLDNFQQGNIGFKILLANILRRNISNELLEVGEYFQNNFINKDAVLALLRHDVVAQNTILNSGAPEEYGLNNEFIKKQARLRIDMAKMEEEFVRLKGAFHIYIAGISETANS